MSIKNSILSYCLLPISYCLFSLPAFSQLNFDFTEGKFMIKGQVTNIETEQAVPMANILILHGGKGLTCDDEGRFTLYVSPKDTLMFSSTGYMNKIVAISNIDSTQYYTIAVEMLHDFIKLKEVIIYPFGDVEGFKKAFIEAKGIKLQGIAPPKYSNKPVAPNFSNPFSLLYDHIKKRDADPDFKP